MRRPVTVACAQVEPVVLDREASLDRLAERTAEARATAPSSSSSRRPTCPPIRPRSGPSTWRLGRPARQGGLRPPRRAVGRGPGPAADRLGEVAREHGVWLVTGVTEIDPERPGTLYNTLLYHDPEGRLALHHRKLVPTNHERLVWGQGDGRGLRAIETRIGRLGGLICWENYMPLARFSLYESGVEIYVASTADDSDAWQATLVHIALESRAFVVAPCHFQRAAAYPEDFPLREALDGVDLVGAAERDPRPGRRLPRRAALRRGGHPLRGARPGAAPRGAPALRPAGHYHRPDVLKLEVNAPPEA